MAKSAPRPSPKERPVIVTTEFRGVFFGHVVDDKELPTKIVLRDARNCIYWSSDVRGVLGLAAGGPTKGCKIGPMVPTAYIWKVTGVFGCSEAAVKAWESGPWNS